MPPARFTKAKVDKGHVPGEFQLYRKRVPVKAQRITGAFTVQTREGTLECDDGWLAVDSQGWPYPIAGDEFDAIYEPVGDVKQDPDTPIDDALDAAQDAYMQSTCSHITCERSAAEPNGTLAYGVPLCGQHASIVGGFMTTADIVSKNRRLENDNEKWQRRAYLLLYAGIILVTAFVSLIILGGFNG